MLTYHQVLTTDLALLTTAAEQWDAAAKKFESVQKDYESQVKAIATDGSWTGQANLAGKSAMQLTHDQYTAAAKEARALASLLRDAHAQFTELRGKLKSVIADAGKDGMRIGDDGRATWTKRDDPAVLHDPDAPAAIAKAENSWNQRIADVVRAFDDADQGVKLALTSAVQNTDVFNSGLNGFNARAEGDIEKVEAREAAELATKLDSTGHLDAKDMAEMQRLFRDNSHDKAFSQTLLSSLGPENLIKFTSRVNAVSHGSVADKNAYLTLDKGMSEALATATRVPVFNEGGKPLKPGTFEYNEQYKNWLGSSDGKFYKSWMNDLKTAGVRKYDYDGITDGLRIGEGHEQKVRGYQALVTMMQNSGDYNAQFMQDLTDDMIKAERKDKNIWDLYGPFGGRKQDWFAHDPVDHALGIMSKNPAAATAFFDPEAAIYDRDANDGTGAYLKNDRFEYLREKRDWAVRDTVDILGQREVHGPDAETDDGHKGFGAALQSAATGRIPGQAATESHPHHTETQTRVFEEIATKYGELTKANQSGMPENIRQNMAHVLADYPSDVHDILGKGGDIGSLDSDPGRAHIDRAGLTQFIRAASEDGSAFHIIHHSQSAEAAERIHGMSRGDFLGRPQGDDTAMGHVTEAGRTLGALDRIKADVISDHQNSEIFRNNWNSKINYHVLGAPLTLIPYAGDGIQRLVDVGTSEYANHLNDKVTADSTDQLISQYVGGQRELEKMISKHADALGVPSKELIATGTRGQDLLLGADSSYADGIGRAGRSTGGVN
ncbi:hypothetical protein [Streptomyces hesseae]|uniref:WXG100 family type VII secretion target n=1 Tax=Streptomyces hesseae TaxID=3075519 RepID=A0ABU2SUM2_9ACTN|nr:hypothetical protein [Streptomyces sp. DSM 40473]MDT0452631.1 hypothetical protein [Streptomyces sp. DSM 40473]